MTFFNQKDFIKDSINDLISDTSDFIFFSEFMLLSFLNDLNVGRTGTVLSTWTPTYRSPGLPAGPEMETV